MHLLLFTIVRHALVVHLGCNQSILFKLLFRIAQLCVCIFWTYRPYEICNVKYKTFPNRSLILTCFPCVPCILLKIMYNSGTHTLLTNFVGDSSNGLRDLSIIGGTWLARKPTCCTCRQVATDRVPYFSNDEGEKQPHPNTGKPWDFHQDCSVRHEGENSAILTKCRASYLRLQ